MPVDNDRTIMTNAEYLLRSPPLVDRVRLVSDVRLGSIGVDCFRIPNPMTPPLPARSCRDGSLSSRKRNVPSSRRRAPAVPPAEDVEGELDPISQNVRNEAIWVRRDEGCSSPAMSSDDPAPPLYPRRLRQLSESFVKPRSVSLNRNIPPRLAVSPTAPAVHNCFHCRLIAEPRRLPLNEPTFIVDPEPELPFPLISRHQSDLDLVSLDRWPIGQDLPPSSNNLSSSRTTSDRAQPVRQDNEYVPEPSSLFNVAKRTVTTTTTQENDLVDLSELTTRPSSAGNPPRTLDRLELPVRNRVNPSGSSTPSSLRRTLTKSSRTEMPPAMLTPKKDAQLLSDIGHRLETTGIICKVCGGCRCKACRSARENVCGAALCNGRHSDNDDCLETGNSGCRHHFGRSVFCFCLCLCWPVRGAIGACRRRCAGLPDPCRCPGDPV